MKIRLFFLHIPKAAGTTFNYVLRREYKAQNRYHINGKDPISSILELKKAPQSKLDLLNVVHGHFAFGLHQVFTDEKKPTYIAFMRNPIDRIISHYNYAKSNKEHYLYKQINENNISLFDYINEPITHEIDNGQLRLIAGDDGEINIGDCNDNLLQTAIKNIENHFLFVGTSEKYAESILLFKQLYPFYGNVNYFSANLGVPKETDRNVQALIEKKCSIEIKLYNYVCDQLDERIRSEGIDQSKLIEFNRINATWTDRYYYFEKVRRWLKKFT